jgi:gamma-glutamyl phosphate reductase
MARTDTYARTEAAIQAAAAAAPVVATAAAARRAAALDRLADLLAGSAESLLAANAEDVACA